MGRIEDGKYLGCYSAIIGDVIGDDKSSGTDYFIGQIDGQYRLLGQRAIACRAYFSEKSECQRPNEFVELPAGKTSLRDLVRGDKLHLKNEKGKDLCDIVFDSLG